MPLNPVAPILKPKGALLGPLSIDQLYMEIFVEEVYTNPKNNTHIAEPGPHKEIATDSPCSATPFSTFAHQWNLTDKQTETFASVVATAGQLSRAITCAFEAINLPPISLPFVAGGSVRDTLLMPYPLIKDVDVYLQIPSSFLAATSESQNSPTPLFQSFLQQIQSRFKSVRSVKMEKLKNGEEFYMSNDILDILRIEDPSLPYPIELMLSSLTPRPSYILNSFDFSICRCGFVAADYMGLPLAQIKKDAQLYASQLKPDPLGRNNMAHQLLPRLEQINDSTFEHNSIIYDGYFLESQKNSTIEFLPTFYTAAQISHSITEHLPRILRKYPDYKARVHPDIYNYYDEESTAQLQKLDITAFIHNSLDNPVSKSRSTMRV